MLESDLVLHAGATGLHVSSAVRLHRLMTVTTGVIQRELGVLSPALLADAEAKLKKLFQLG